MSACWLRGCLRGCVVVGVGVVCGREGVWVLGVWACGCVGVFFFEL